MDTKPPKGYDYVEESADSSMRETHALISYIRALDHGHEPLVQPILTPRFALSCSEDLLTRLHRFADSEPNLHIQTHISESKDEVCDVRKRFGTSYAEVYDKYGLLRKNTILGHAVHLTKDEVELIKQRGAGISHCPTSNFNLNSGIAPIGYYLDRGVKVMLFSSVMMECIFIRYFLLGWIRHRCFWWILPFYIKCHPKCQHRGQSSLIHWQERTSVPMPISLFRVLRSSQ